MTAPRRVPTEVERTAGHVRLDPTAGVIARLGVALEESRREVQRLHAEVAERTRERDDARRLADLTTEQEAANVVGEQKHRQARGWNNGFDGKSAGVECVCGETFGGFPTMTDARKILGYHIAAGNAREIAKLLGVPEHEIERTEEPA